MTEFGRFLRTETVGGFILLAATAIALLAADGPLSDVYLTLRDTEIGPHFLHLNLTVSDWAKGGLLALFSSSPGFSLLAVRLGIARLPSELGKRDLVAVAMLGGVGFTVSLLIADLALDGPDMELAKSAVLIASVLASLLAAVLLLRRSKVHSTSTI